MSSGASADVRFTAGEKAAQERWSPVNREFLEYVERTPGCVRRSRYEGLEVLSRAVFGRLQAWPTFVSAEQRRRLERGAVGVCRLLKRLVHHRFAGDPAAVARFYGLGAERSLRLAAALEVPGALDGVVARGDFVEAAEGLRCIELNMTSDLGGWETPLWAEVYRRIPLLADFLDGRPVSSRNTVELLFRHVLERAVRLGHGDDDGGYHLLFAAPQEQRAPEPLLRYAEKLYRRVLAELAPAAEGSVGSCLPDELRAGDQRVWHGERPVAAVIELYDGVLDPAIEELWCRGRVGIYNGPPTPLLRDKRNLALLSAHAAASDLFDADERQLIAELVPWSRVVAAGEESFAGRRAPLADLLLAARRRLVLKPARLSQGRDVHVGCYTEPEVWRRTVARALEEGDWIAQEYVEPMPRPYQTGEEGYGPHDVVWGLFVFGERYGGGFLRVQERGGHGGVINSARGAADGILFEVAAEDGADSAAADAAGGAAEPGSVAFGRDALERQERLSSTARRFLEWVERNPRACVRDEYAVLDSDWGRIQYRLQAWPAFIDAAAVERSREAAVGLTRLVEQVPARLFGDDADRLAAHYGLDEATARLLVRLLTDEERMEPLLARGDFFDTVDGLRCMEINLTSNLGGWKTALFEDLYRRAPPVRRFLEESGVRVSTVDTLEVFFAHLVEVAQRSGLGEEGTLDLVLAVPPSERETATLKSFGSQRYRDYLRREKDLDGRLEVCAYEELEVRGERVFLDGRRVHVLVEVYGGFVPRPLFLAWMAGGLAVLNGPVSRVVDDRRTLALLSEYADSDLFSREERQLVERCLPWTRRMVDDFTVYRGRREPLPEIALREREAMVLKHVASARGEKVILGRETGPERWRSLVEGAVADGHWIVQQTVEPVPYVFQSGAAGWAPHDLVWGFFVFGRRYGGGFLRMLPRGGTGVINSARGAEEDILFVVGEE